MLNVIKKDGTKESFNIKKILQAVSKSEERIGSKLSLEEKEKLEDTIYDYLSDSPIWKERVSTKDIHSAVIQSLKYIGREDVAKSYQEYRDYKTSYAKEFEELREHAETTITMGDRENANFDSSLISTKGSLIKGYLTKALYKQFYLSKKEKEYTKRGDIYIHDMRDMILQSINCCLFDMATVLKGGFEMSNVVYTEPKSVLTALQVIGDVTLAASAQQFGGFTIAEIDKVLLPYCKKTLENAKKEAIEYFGTNPSNNSRFVWNRLKRELEQGFQSLELKLNTVPSSRGDFAFTTLTFGQWLNSTSEEDKRILHLIGSTILKTRLKGHGGKQAVFPKLVFLYDSQLAHKDLENKELFEEAVKCSAKCMYPDYLSLTGYPKVNKVAQVYLESNNTIITSPMGCRAYLSPWKDPETQEYVAIGRCNIGAVSLNLPIIMAVCKKTYGNIWKEFFWQELRDRLEVIRNFLKKRYEIIKHTKASTNPMAFTQGGFYKGFLDPEDEIGSLTDYMTASFGFTALHEATKLWNGHSLSEDPSFAKEFLEYLNNYINKIKEEDNHLYAIYATPAESLCETQAKQYLAYTGDPQFGKYFTNSFHLHVSEDITPFEKQIKETTMFHQSAGGHIQYCRLDNPKNLLAVKAIIERGMELGLYQGVNFDAAYCEDCHQHSTNVMHTCPYCGSHNLSVISRVCGYLGYSNINGKSRLNDGKMAEIADRKSM